MKNFMLGVSTGLALSVLIFIITAGSASASQTLSLVDEYRDGSDKVCVYSDGRHTATVYKEGAGSCPSKYIKH